MKSAIPFIFNRGLAAFVSVTAIVLLASSSTGQDWSFTHDLNGNFEKQTPAIPLVPQILAHPQSQVVKPGELASFFVVVADTRGLTYQWRFNGTNLAGATSDALLRTNVSALNEGQYSVVLSNSSGSVTSEPAALMLDGDGDGLADSWEQSNFGGLAQNPGGDFDGDGISNLDEFNEGTSPTNSASAQFHLTVMSDGGQVSVTPTKLSYTNGEIVTLTATAFPSEIFHGWTGSTISRTNPLTLVMNANKTLFANFQPKILVWTGPASGDWHNPLNWSPNFVPTAVDEVTLSAGGSVSINEPAACSKLTFSGGTLIVSGLLSVSNLTVTGGTLTCNVDLSVPNLSFAALLNGPGTLTVSNAMTWSVGTLGGGGRTIIAPEATLTLNNSANVALDNRILDNAGTTLWTGAGGMIMVNTAVITNRPGALFELRSSPGFATSGPGAKSIDNAGTLRKTTSAGTANLGTLALNNYGAIEIETGTITSSSAFNIFGSLALAPGATARLSGISSASGTITNSPTGLVDWVGPFTLNSGAQLNGSGVYRVTGGPLTLNTDITIQNLEMANSINGSGNLTVSNAMTWSAGTLGGGGRAIIAPGATLTLNNSANVALDNRILDNAGTTLWTGAGGMIVVNTTVITNRPGALFELRSSSGFATSGPGAKSIDNAGTLRKTTSAGTANLGTLALNNYGAIEIEAGTLASSSAFNIFGSLILAPGTTTRFSGISSASGTITNPSTALVDWVGPFTLNSGAQLNGSGVYRVTGGPLTLNTDIAIQNLEMANSINGSGNLTVSNAMTWSAGTLGGGGRAIIAPGATLTMNHGTTIALDNRILDNAGTTLWTGAGGMIVVNTTVITNRPGALFELRSSPGFATSGPGAKSIDNAGTLRKTTSAGTANLGTLALNNYGAIEIETGTIASSSAFNIFGSLALAPGATARFSGGTGSASGTITNSSTALVEWAAGAFTLNSGVQLNGSGIYRLSGSSLTLNTDITVQNLEVASSINGSGNLTVSSAMTWSGGTLGSGGRAVIVPGATLTINNGVTVGLDGRILENAGTTIWTGVGINLVNTTHITNCPGALFEIQNASGFGFFFAGAKSFENAGTLRKTTSTGTTSMGALPLNNHGTVDLRSGILTVNGGFTASSGSTLKCALGGTTAGTGYARLQKSGDITLGGTLSLDFLPGFTPATNDSFTVVSAGSRNGTFANFHYPSNLVTMQMSNTPNSVIVNVSAIVVALPQPVLNIEQIAPGAARLYWSTNYPDFHLEYNTSLGTTNWAVSALTPVVTSTNFVITNSMFGAQKYYRLSRVPAPFTPPPPSLTIQHASPTSVRLLWPAEENWPFLLQSSTNLSLTNWVSVSPLPAIFGENNVVTNSIGGTQMFYRLATP